MIILLLIALIAICIAMYVLFAGLVISDIDNNHKLSSLGFLLGMASYIIYEEHIANFKIYILFLFVFLCIVFIHKIFQIFFKRK